MSALTADTVPIAGAAVVASCCACPWSVMLASIETVQVAARAHSENRAHPVIVRSIAHRAGMVG